MPAGEMILVNPPNFDPSDCGPAAVLTRIDQSTFQFSGGYLATDEECTITLNANMTVNVSRSPIPFLLERLQPPMEPPTKQLLLPP